MKFLNIINIVLSLVFLYDLATLYFRTRRVPCRVKEETIVIAMGLFALLNIGRSILAISFYNYNPTLIMEYGYMGSALFGLLICHFTIHYIRADETLNYNNKNKD